MKKILQVLIISVSIVFCIVLTERFLRREEGYVKNYDFYETDETYDVLYFGSSHAVMGILPMEIWNEYGITSFNLANEGQKLNGDYWTVKNALEQKKPSLVVVDVFTVMFDSKWTESTVNFLHESLDPMPVSQTKTEAIRDLVPKDTRLAFIWPFSIYHNRWENIDESFFVNAVSYQKGAYENASQVVPRVAQLPELLLVDKSNVNRTETLGKEYLRRIIELCQENDVQILLTAIPFCGTEADMGYINSVYEIAEEYGVQFVNGMDENLVNTQCDFLDAQHLNSSGARKWSSFLGAYMKEHYNLPDHRKDGAYVSWNEDYEEYRMIFERNQLNGTTDIYAYLMLLADPGFSSQIKISADSGIYQDDLFWALMENAGDIGRPDDSSAEHSFVIEHAQEGVVYATEESIGFPNDVNADIEIMVFDSRTGELVSHTAFSSEEENAMVYPVQEE